jgi:hypothetical protein
MTSLIESDSNKAITCNQKIAEVDEKFEEELKSIKVSNPKVTKTSKIKATDPKNTIRTFIYLILIVKLNIQMKKKSKFFERYLRQIEMT